MSEHTPKNPVTVRSRGRRGQNYLVIWVDGNIDLTQEDFQNSITKLRSAVNEVTTCLTPVECIECLNVLNEGKAFVISSGALGENLVATIHDMPKVDTIFIFCGNKARHEQWASKWPKIQGVYTSINPICESLKKVAHASDHNDIPMSFLPTQSIASVSGSNKENLDRLPASFMYSVIFKEIILEIDDEPEKQMNALIAYCRTKSVPESELVEFQQRYYKRSPVWWYTRETFLYGMLNQALRTLDMEGMTKMGFFIRHLHLRLEQFYAEQSNDFQKEFIVFRGQGLSQQDFQSLSETKGGLLSFNNFLSTSKKKDVSMRFVRETMKQHEDYVGVLFVMGIDPRKISTSITPFAFVDKESAVSDKEDEILFTMHTIFRVVDIKQASENSRLFEVKISLTDKNDPQMIALNHYVKNDLRGSTAWQRLGDLMLQYGDFEQAEELYNQSLEDARNDKEKGIIYHQRGWAEHNLGKYQKAVESYEKSLKIKAKIVPEEDVSLADTYNNISLAYMRMGDYFKALKYLEKALEIDKKTLPPNHPDLATSYKNIGGVYQRMGDYSKALEFNEKALKIREKALPLNHPSMASSYCSIGGVYSDMGDYLKALEFYEIALKIREKALPSNHPNLAFSYSCIGGVHNDMGDYTKALEFYEKALKIREKALPPNHPDLAYSYGCIGGVHNVMGDYTKALEFYEIGLKIREKALPLNHLTLAASYNNFGSVYHSLGNYSMALEFTKKSLEIKMNSLPENHRELALPYNCFGKIYRSMKKYSKSLDNFTKCLRIWQQGSSENHPDVAFAHSNVGDVHRLMGDYQKALKFHQKALDIQENVKCNPLDSATTYVNFGETYREMKDYTTALKYYEKGLKVRKEKLPKNHPGLAAVYHNMSKLYLATREYSTAMKYVQQAVDIAQEKLPSTHPHLLEYRETFEKIRKKQ